MGEVSYLIGSHCVCLSLGDLYFCRHNFFEKGRPLRKSVTTSVSGIHQTGPISSRPMHTDLAIGGVLVPSTLRPRVLAFPLRRPCLRL